MDGSMQTAYNMQCMPCTLSFIVIVFFLAKKENILAPRANAVEKHRTGAFRTRDQTLSFFSGLKKNKLVFNENESTNTVVVLWSNVYLFITFASKQLLYIYHIVGFRESMYMYVCGRVHTLFASKQRLYITLLFSENLPLFIMYVRVYVCMYIHRICHIYIYIYIYTYIHTYGVNPTLLICYGAS